MQAIQTPEISLLQSQSIHDARRDRMSRYEQAPQEDSRGTWLVACGLAFLVKARRSCWGKDWGKKPHGFQPISADLDPPKTA
jgi:hypothetical protein